MTKTKIHFHSTNYKQFKKQLFADGEIVVKEYFGFISLIFYCKSSSTFIYLVYPWRFPGIEPNIHLVKVHCCQIIPRCFTFCNLNERIIFKYGSSLKWPWIRSKTDGIHLNTFSRKYISFKFMQSLSTWSSTIYAHLLYTYSHVNI